MPNDSHDAKRSPVDIFVRRPILAIVLSLLFLLAGWLAWRDIPTLQFPKLENTTLQISTVYPGATAEMVAGFVTNPIENAASRVPGVDFVESTSQAGYSLVNVRLKLNENSANALAFLSAQLDQVRYMLPAGVQKSVIEAVRADRLNAGFYLGVTLENGVSRSQMSDYLNRQIIPLLNAIPNVQKVSLEGGRDPAMRIWPKSDLMAVLDVDADELANAIKNSNVISTAGTTENNLQRQSLAMNTSISSVTEYENIIIKTVDDHVIRLKDVATVELGGKEGAVYARQGQSGAIYIGIWTAPGSNEIEVADTIYRVLEQIKPTLPAGVTINIASDVTQYMRRALTEIFKTLVETILIVGLVVFLLMGTLRAALVPLVVIPISLLGSIAVMHVMGFSLNLLTVLALVLSVGLVVDDAIVVVENVSRYLQAGYSRTQAALLSSRQLYRPIIAMTITLAAVYAPISLLGGLTGELFKEFAFSLSIAVILSGVVALTLSPVMSGYMMRTGSEEGTFKTRLDHSFSVLQNSYARCLVSVIKHRSVIVSASALISVFGIYFYFASTKELAPVEDQSEIIIIAQGPPDSSMSYMYERMHEVVDAMSALPDVQDIWQVILPGIAFGGQNFSDPGDRDLSTQELLPQASQYLSRIVGLNAFPILPAALPTAGNFDVELLILSSYDHAEMNSYSERILEKARASGKFMFVDTDLKLDLPQTLIKLDRERISDLGMTISEVSRQLGILTSGNYINHFDMAGRAHEVIAMLGDDERATPESILDFHIRVPDGSLIPLSFVASIERTTVPRNLGRFQQTNSLRIFGGVAQGVSKEEALTFLEGIALNILPGDYRTDYAGESRQMRNETNSLTAALGLATIFVFFVLLIQFNGIRDPLVILLGSAPLSLSSALFFTYIDWTTLNIFSQIGLITLLGIIVKNAILIVECAKYEQLQGSTRSDAIVEASLQRLRPVLMTAAATVLGHFPLVIVSGAGAEARNSIGIILVSGMLVGTLFTLFVLPAIYSLFGFNQATD